MMDAPSVAWSRTIVGRRAAAMAKIEQMLTDSERIETEFSFGSLVWRIWGRGHAQDVVLLHGGSGNWAHWFANVHALSKTYRVITPDLPGFGESATPPSPHTADGVAEALSDGLDSVLSGPRYHLAGFSFGAMISGHLARLDKRVASLALVGAVGLGVSRNSRPPLIRIDPERPVYERWFAQARNLGMLMLAEPQAISDLAIHLQDQNVCNARLKSVQLSKRETLAGALEGLDLPIAAVWGENDSIYLGMGWDEREALFAALSNARTPDQIADGGHWIAFERPEAFNRWLLEWLGAHPLD